MKIMAYSSQSQKFGTILLRLRQVLSDYLGALETGPIDDSRVILAKRSSYSAPKLAEDHVVVRPLSGLIAGEHGGGRLGLPISRVVAIDIFLRSGIDDAFSDSVALTESDFGHFDRQEQILDAILLKPLLDADDLPLLIEPPHPVQAIEDPDKPDEDRAVGFLSETIYVELKYVVRINSLPD